MKAGQSRYVSKQHEAARVPHQYPPPDNPQTGEPFDRKQAWILNKSPRAGGVVLAVPSMRIRRRCNERHAWPWYGKELRTWLDDHNYTAVQLSRELGIRPTAVRRWCKDNSPLPPGLYMALKYILQRDNNRYSDAHDRRVERDRRANEKFYADKEARRLEVEEGGGDGDNESEYL